MRDDGSHCDLATSMGPAPNPFCLALHPAGSPWCISLGLATTDSRSRILDATVVGSTAKLSTVCCVEFVRPHVRKQPELETFDVNVRIF